jgi:DNA-binding response OmpR family regulator
VTERVLIVDDDPDILRLLEIKLGRAGYEVMTAHDGEIAIETARKDLPEVVITGYLLPKLDGLEVARQIKAGVDPAPLVLFLSVKDQPEDIAACFAAGGDDFIGKPFSPDVVIERIKVAIIKSDNASAQQG